jgi:hypothetical protein
MPGLALLGAQAALPQHVPHHVNNLLPRTKEGAEETVLHGGRAHFLQCPVHDGPGISKNYICLHLLVLLVARIVVAPVVTRVIVACISNGVTHLLLLGVVLTVVYCGSGGSSGRGSRSSTHLVLCELWIFVASCCV